MGDSENQPGGPDLTQGVDAASLAEGTMLLGHANGEAVLLARTGGSVYAIGATCTHYSGPLAEGLLVGDTVRCPLHHACFSLRTGEALRAPALSPVPCWRVEERNGKVYVTEKTERDPLAPVAGEGVERANAPRRIVIVGAGAAGSAAAEMLRREGHTGDITMIDEDPSAPVDRPNLSKDYLAGTAQEDWIPLRPADFYARHGIEILRDRVTRLDVAARLVERASGEALSFDALLLATGAEPVRLSIPGAEQEHVHYLRTLADSKAIIAGAERSGRAVVIGASFIGLEVAASLRTRGLEVDVVAPESLPLERVMGSELGRLIESLHREQGVNFHLQNSATRIEPDAVVLESGGRLEAEMVVIGVGVRPRVALAKDAGLAVDNGVVVNEYLETSAPGIYAAGDIARWPDPHTGERIRVEHWVVAQRQGQTAARNILGARARFESVPFFWSAHYDVRIRYVGHAGPDHRRTVEGDAAKRDVAVRFERDGHVEAVATVGRDRESLEAEEAMERDAGRRLSAAAASP